MNVNAGHEGTSKALIIHQIQPIRGITREAVISTDSQQNITFMNPVAEKISGWKQAEAQGKSLREILFITQGEQGPRLENLYSDENLDSDIGAKQSPA